MSEINPDLEVKADVDAAIEHYNEMHPDLPDINKKQLAAIVGTKEQNLTNYNRAKTPKAFHVLFNISVFTGYPIEKILVPIQSYEIVEIQEGYEVWCSFPEKEFIALFGEKDKALKFIKSKKQ